jgi:hypothetical protein
MAVGNKRGGGRRLASSARKERCRESACDSSTRSFPPNPSHRRSRKERRGPCPARTGGRRTEIAHVVLSIIDAVGEHQQFCSQKGSSYWIIWRRTYRTVGQAPPVSPPAGVSRPPKRGAFDRYHATMMIARASYRRRAFQEPNLPRRSINVPEPTLQSRRIILPLPAGPTISGILRGSPAGGRWHEGAGLRSLV